MKRLGVMLGVLALVGAGVSAQQKAAAGGDEAAIAKIRTAYNNAIMAGDGAGIAKLYAPDGVEMPPNAPAAKGRAEIEKYHKDLAQQVMIHGSSITPTETHVSGTLAYDTGTYKQQIMPMKGGGISDDHGKYVVVLKKDGGNWWIAAAIYNSDLPLPAPPPAKK
jgi:uncharacterized protein (TIGR02246 family)